MQTFLIGGCTFCGKQDCVAGQCQSVYVEEVFSFPEEEFTTSVKEVDWTELVNWWNFGNRDWDDLERIVSKMLKNSK